MSDPSAADPGPDQNAPIPPQGRFLVSLRRLIHTDLPPHDFIEGGSVVDLRSFLQLALREAITFVDNIPQTFRNHKIYDKRRPLPNVYCRLHTIKHDVKKKSLKESWFAREMVHPNRRENGMAHIDEFDTLLRQQHSKNEVSYAKSVVAANEVLSWDDDIAAIATGDSLGEYREVSMRIYEMVHTSRTLLVENRVFPVLVITAKTPPNGFVVVQIPLDLKGRVLGDRLLFVSGRNKRVGPTNMTRRKCIQGKYVSVERVTVQDEDVRWEMATAGGAQGWLHVDLQKLFTPPSIAKDVWRFLRWVQSGRSSS
ncbi:uncharacterized protein BKCO1_3600052 [Diplodia corticola]|uniref:DUF3074 domain-containing protein n=1 Tax=Diplodia corticola TaxID=236234 RepID=A0A1J9QWH1_9PEZI|nr:uncharacterized protein BKCO1_3600052 [Diplodia corticola]OJD32737.1 hypothetical protein BKCO1_3600052 [Diplodia corticola]